MPLPLQTGWEGLEKNRTSQKTCRQCNGNSNFGKKFFEFVKKFKGFPVYFISESLCIMELQQWWRSGS